MFTSKICHLNMFCVNLFGKTTRKFIVSFILNMLCMTQPQEPQPLLTWMETCWQLLCLHNEMTLMWPEDPAPKHYMSHVDWSASFFLQSPCCICSRIPNCRELQLHKGRNWEERGQIRYPSCIVWESWFFNALDLLGTLGKIFLWFMDSDRCIILGSNDSHSQYQSINWCFTHKAGIFRIFCTANILL